MGRAEHKRGLLGLSSDFELATLLAEAGRLREFAGESGKIGGSFRLLDDIYAFFCFMGLPRLVFFLPFLKNKKKKNLNNSRDVLDLDDNLLCVDKLCV